MTAARFIRQARHLSALTQRGLAARSGVTQSALAAIESSSHDTKGSTLERLLHAAGCSLVLLPTTARAASDWTDDISREIHSNPSDEGTVFRLLLGLSEDLSSVAPLIRLALCVTPPTLCGDARYDAAVAAIVDYHLTRVGLPLPEWVDAPSRALDNPWVITPFLREGEVPERFLRHGVHLAESELLSV